MINSDGRSYLCYLRLSSLDVHLWIDRANRLYFSIVEEMGDKVDLRVVKAETAVAPASKERITLCMTLLCIRGDNIRMDRGVRRLNGRLTCNILPPIQARPPLQVVLCSWAFAAPERYPGVDQ